MASSWRFGSGRTLTDETPPALRRNAADYAAGALQLVATAAGAAFGPGIGGDLVATAVGQIFGSAVPGQITDRLTTFVIGLEKRLREHGRRLDLVSENLTAVQLALLSEGWRLSARQSDPQIAERIAKLVADGLTASDHVASYKRETLDLIDGLSDAELLLLSRFDNPHGRQGPPLTDEERRMERTVTNGEFAAMSTEDQDRFRATQPLLGRRLERLYHRGLCIALTRTVLQ